MPGRPFAVGGPSKNTKGRSPLARIRSCERASVARKVSSAFQRPRTSSSSSPVVFGSSGYFLIYPSANSRLIGLIRTETGNITGAATRRARSGSSATPSPWAELRISTFRQVCRCQRGSYLLRNPQCFSRSGQDGIVIGVVVGGLPKHLEVPQQSTGCFQWFLGVEKCLPYGFVCSLFRNLQPRRLDQAIPSLQIRGVVRSADRASLTTVRERAIPTR